jgi:hypothetical protein
MAPLNRFLAFVILVLSTAFVVPAHAENGTFVTLDSTDIELVARSTQTTTVAFTIPARFDLPGVALRRWSISQDGRLIDSTGTTMAIRTPANGTPELVASFDLSKLNMSGHYLATLEFVAAKPPPPRIQPAAPSRQAVPNPPVGEPEIIEQTVQVKLNRPAADLRISLPLHIERTIYFPSVWSLQPTAITLTEAGGKSWVKIDPLQWDVVLRHGDDAPEGVLRVQMPSGIDGWGQGLATIALQEPAPLGTTAGTLTIRAPQLAAQTIDFAVTVVSRVSALWLLPVIVIGILLGVRLRNGLDAKQARLAAILPAEREIMTLDDLINATADSSFQARLKTIRDALAGTIEPTASTAEAIAAATKTAADAREEVVKAASGLRDKLQASLQAWSRPGTVTEPLPDAAAEALARLRDRVAALTKALADGSLNDVDGEVTNTLPVMAGSVRTALSEWVRQFGELKAEPPLPWPNTRLAAKVAGVSADVDRLAQELTGSDGAEALWKNLIGAALLLAHCRQDLFGTVMQEVATSAKSASAVLRAFGVKLKGHAAAIDSAAASLPDAAVASGAKGVEAFTNGLNALRAAICDGLEAAWGETAHPLPGLAQGDFSLALAELEKKRPAAEKDLGEAGAPSPARRSALAIEMSRIQEPIIAAVIPAWAIILEPATATVFEPVIVRARLIAIRRTSRSPGSALASRPARLLPAPSSTRSHFRCPARCQSGWLPWTEAAPEPRRC